MIVLRAAVIVLHPGALLSTVQLSVFYVWLLLLLLLMMMLIQQQAGGMRRRLYDDNESTDVNIDDEIQRQRQQRRVQFTDTLRHQLTDDDSLTCHTSQLLTADLAATKYHIGTCSAAPKN